MDDSTYCFVQDVKARKTMAYGSRKRVVGKGKTVRMPSDHLTAKQRKELNGKMVTYSLDKPMAWKELGLLPYDLQKEYLEKLKEKYNPSLDDLRKMLHLAPQTIKTILDNLGIEWGKGYRNPAQKLKWKEFVDELEPKAEQEEKPKETPRPPKEVVHQAKILFAHIRLEGKPAALAQTILTMLDSNETYEITISKEELPVMAVREEDMPNESCDRRANEDAEDW